MPHCDCSWNNRKQHAKPLRPPTKKAFREHLNKVHENTPNHRNGAYRQRTRPYGDYLYAQDRDKFNVEYEEWKTKP
jgi:NADH:ubiquinone oxidoreductase subunit